jgi:uncharacterized protein YjdB
VKRITVFIAIFSFLLVACVKDPTQVVLQTIAIKPDTVTLEMGSSITLNPTFTPAVFNSIPVEWTSNNSSVVTVSYCGTILAIKSGTAWVTIKDKNSATSGKVMVVIP